MTEIGTHQSNAAKSDPTALTTEGLLREIAHLRDLLVTRLDGMDKAILAALQAQKEAVAEQSKSNAMAIAKSEAAFTKQIDGLGDRLGDVKDRVTVIEGKSQGGAALWALMVGGILVAAAVFTAIIRLTGTS